ncbi:MAG TPA: hypothetical protein VHU61_08170 [Solirubrobacteraceae bacterium]|jgi:hypothetical protein|nr:hypothetical protein [Solirubrobacteraceae bacterium]
MRSGALPLLCWAALLALSGALNAVWAGASIQTATFGAGVFAIVLFAAAVLLRPQRAGPEAVTRASFATVIVAIGFATLMFGFSFGHFIIYLGVGLMVAGVGRLLLELRHQRRARSQR